MKPIFISKEQTQKLDAKRKKIQKELAEVGPFFAGTLTTLHRICGTPTCRCRKGGKKHKAMYFTWKENKESRSLYVPVSMHKEVIQWEKNYKKLKRLIKQLSDIQRDILRLR
jgi:hypothetical protein